MLEALSFRSIGGWVKALQKIRQPGVRAQLGCIIWWDWISESASLEDRREILRYMREWDAQVAAGNPLKVRQKSVFKGLVALGYPESEARKRSELWEKKGE